MVRKPKELKLIPPKEVAKLVRKDLKQNFPKQKFSVRVNPDRNIDVNWSNGPSQDSVENIVGHYSRATFEGLTDQTIYTDSPYGNRFIVFSREKGQEPPKKKETRPKAAEIPPLDPKVSFVLRGLEGWGDEYNPDDIARAFTELEGNREDFAKKKFLKAFQKEYPTEGENSASFKREFKRFKLFHKMAQ